MAHDPVRKEWGVAVQSRVLGVGSIVPWARAGVGAIATQAWANTDFGPDGLRLLGNGKSAAEAVATLVKGDRGRDHRQVGVVDARGAAAAYTGTGCLAWAGHKIGKHYCVQGNILANETVVAGMATAFEKTKGRLADRMIAALRAGQNNGGDKRGRQSAAILIVRERGGYAGRSDRMVDLRVEDHKTPIEELARILKLHKRTFGRRWR